MDLEEHERVVRAAGGLLESFSIGTSGWGTGEGEGEANVAFDALKKCYTTTKSGRVVYITKGIHQPLTDPHMQLVCAVEGRQAEGMVFHLNLSAKLVASALQAEEPGLFQWKGVQFTFINHGLKTSWPKVPAAATKKGSGLLRRRQSVSLADHDLRLGALTERLAREEEERLERIERERREVEEARLAQEAARLKAEQVRAAADRRVQAVACAQIDGRKRGQLFTAFFSVNPNFTFIKTPQKKEIVDEGKTVTIAAKSGKVGGKLRYDRRADKIVKVR